MWLKPIRFEQNYYLNYYIYFWELLCILCFLLANLFFTMHIVENVTMFVCWIWFQFLFYQFKNFHMFGCYTLIIFAIVLRFWVPFFLQIGDKLKGKKKSILLFFCYRIFNSNFYKQLLTDHLLVWGKLGVVSSTMALLDISSVWELIHANDRMICLYLHHIEGQQGRFLEWCVRRCSSSPSSQEIKTLFRLFMMDFPLICHQSVSGSYVEISFRLPLYNCGFLFLSLLNTGTCERLLCGNRTHV